MEKTGERQVLAAESAERSARVDPTPVTHSALKDNRGNTIWQPHPKVHYEFDHCVAR